MESGDEIDVVVEQVGGRHCQAMELE